MAWGDKKKVKYDVREKSVNAKHVTQADRDALDDLVPDELKKQNNPQNVEMDLYNGLLAKDEAYADAISWLNTLKDEHDFPLGIELFNDGYEDKIRGFYDTDHIAIVPEFTFDMAMDTINTMVIRPTLFVFCIHVHEGSPRIVMVPAFPYTQNAAIKPVTHDHVMPDWLDKQGDNVYLPVGKSFSKARQALLAEGFVEDPEIMIKLP